MGDMGVTWVHPLHLSIQHFLDLNTWERKIPCTKRGVGAPLTPYGGILVSCMVSFLHPLVYLFKKGTLGTVLVCVIDIPLSVPNTSPLWGEPERCVGARKGEH